MALLKDRQSKQRRADLGEFQIGPALMQPAPAECDGALDPGAEVVATAAGREKRRVDSLDVNAAILRGFDAVRGLDKACARRRRNRRGANYIPQIRFRPI